MKMTCDIWSRSSRALGSETFAEIQSPDPTRRETQETLERLILHP